MSVAPGYVSHPPDRPEELASAGRTSWVQAEVLDGNRGEVDYRGTPLAVSAVRGRAKGQSVVVVVRPEVLELEPQRGGPVPWGVLGGRVLALSFLGAVTRLKISVEDRADLIADVASVRARAFPIGAEVLACFSSDAARVLNLPAG